MEAEVESYMRYAWHPVEEQVDWKAGDWWRHKFHNVSFPRIHRLARGLLATQVNDLEYRLPPAGKMLSLLLIYSK